MLVAGCCAEEGEQGGPAGKQLLFGVQWDVSIQTEDDLGKDFFFYGNRNTGRSLCQLRDVNIKNIGISKTAEF